MPFQPFAYDGDRAQWYSAEQWNWLKVEIEEIRRCAAAGDQAHDRLALLLIDHLVEVIVDREINAQQSLHLPDHVIENFKQARANGAEIPPELIEAINNHTSPNDRERRDRRLHEKTRHLVKLGVLTSEERQVLARLHEYRNEAYHQDKLDPYLISDLVLAYMLLAGELLTRHRPVMFVESSSDRSKPIVTPGELPGLLTDGLEINLKEMSRRFCEHAQVRVTAIGESVDMARSLLLVEAEDAFEPKVSEPDDEFDRLLMALNRVTPANLLSWEKRAGLLKVNVTSLVNLIVCYIGLDSDLSLIEPSVRTLQAILDESEQDADGEAKEAIIFAANRSLISNDGMVVGPNVPRD